MNLTEMTILVKF